MDGSRIHAYRTWGSGVDITDTVGVVVPQAQRSDRNLLFTWLSGE
jgi:hypothetical protein